MIPTQAARAQSKFERTNDPQFNVAVASPAYIESHPKLLVDEAHFNYHTSDGTYKPLVEPEDLLDAKIVGVTPQAAALGIEVGLTGRQAVERMLAE